MNQDRLSRVLRLSVAASAIAMSAIVAQPASAACTPGSGSGSTVCDSPSGPATADAENATASGNGASASGAGSTVTGAGASATVAATDSVALGSGSLADQANTVSVGTVGNERRIVNVATATAGTDAVNLDQVNALVGGGSPTITDDDQLDDGTGADSAEYGDGAIASAA